MIESNNPLNPVCVLSIAGSDSGGGAGIQADIKTISALGGFACTAISSITAQNTLGVKEVYALSGPIIEAQIKAITDDLQVDAVKIGMLPDSSHPEIIAKFIKAGKLKNIVLDPVMVATSGDALISNSNILPLIQYLFPCADLITPNLNETQVLVKHPVSDTKQMLQAAKELLELGPKAVLIKGGHLQSEKMTDLLLLSSRVEHPFWFSLPKIESNNLHGTGCTLSSAIAFFLGNGENIEKAVHSAKNYIYQAILSGKNLHIGNGHGPVNHFFEPIPLTNKKYYKKEEF